MATLNPTTLRAAEYAVTTSDAYSFPVYGSSAWMACYALLFRRGYNAVEAMAIMRSKLTRLAADSRRNPDAHATSRDLARFLDSMHRSTLQDIVDDYVLGIFGPDDTVVAPMPSRCALRLVWSRS